MKNREFQELVDRNLSGLVWDEQQRRSVLLAIDKEEKPVKKVSMSVIVVALILCMSVPALAAGLMFSMKVDAARTADRALETVYGITDEMLTHFSREEQEMPDGSVIVTYSGGGDLHYVLGDYTAIVKNGEATIAWSHDGENTEGGFDAEAWGAEQLGEMVRRYKEERYLGDAYEKGRAIAQANHALEEMGGMRIAEGTWDEMQLTLQDKSKLSVEEMVTLAKEAVQMTYGLSAAQMEKLEYNPYLSSFSEDGATICYCTSLWLIQEPAVDPNVFPVYTEGDGEYVVFVNTQTGVIESLKYNADLVGNG